MDRSSRRRGSGLFVAGVVAFGLVAAGIGYAAIPDASGVIHACYQKSTGQLRVIDTEAGDTCNQRENRLDWNQAGPQGPPGGAPGYARVENGVLDAARSQNVVSMTLTGGGGIFGSNLYCFDLNFAASNVVASATAMDPYASGWPAVDVAGTGTFDCPAGADAEVESFNNTFFVLFN